MNDIYENYGIRQKSYKKQVLVLIAVVFLVFFLFLLLKGKNIETNQAEAFERNASHATNYAVNSSSESGVSGSEINFSYQYINNEFVFYVNSSRAVSTIEVFIDGDKINYNIVDGKLPMQEDSSVTFKIDKQMCDKEHEVKLKTEFSENKIITEPLVCANLIAKK